MPAVLLRRFLFSGCGCTVLINPYAVYFSKLRADFCADQLCDALAELRHRVLLGMIFDDAVNCCRGFVLLHVLVFCELHFSKNRSVIDGYLNVRRQVFKRCPPKTMRTQDS